MKSNSFFVTVAMLAIILGGCVSSRKYNEMKNSRDHFRAQYDNLKTVERENNELRDKLRLAENQLQQLRNSLEQQKNEFARIKEYNQDLSRRYEEAIKENSRLLSSYSAEKTEMERRLAFSQDELLQQERRLRGLEETIGLQSYNLEFMKSDLMSREQRVAELEKLVADQEAQMSRLRTSLQNALRGYKTGDLSIEERNGRIYVSLSQQLLFKTGSDQIDPQGEKALMQLAKALGENPEVEIMVEGHTDDVGSVNYNWDLSVRRATAVVKILGIHGVAPHRLVAAGRGMHRPIVPNTSDANRARNRRTEIILSPNLDKLYELSKK